MTLSSDDNPFTGEVSDETRVRWVVSPAKARKWEFAARRLLELPSDLRVKAMAQLDTKQRGKLQSAALELLAKHRQEEE